MTRLALIAATALAALPLEAQAAVAFNRMDANRDGVVDFDEASREIATLARTHFTKFDLDRDGVLSPQEYAGFDAFLDIMYEGR